MKISIVAALDEKRGIGKNGQLPWHIPEDLKHFKKITTGHPVIMGRKTFESIGRVLLGRTNIVITQNSKFKIQALASQGEALRSYVANSVEKAIEIAKKSPSSDEVFVIGGGQLYAQAIEKADKLYLTLVEGDYNCDTFFPDYSNFKITKSEEGESGGKKYKFLELVK